MTGIHKIMTNELPLGVPNTIQTRTASWLLVQEHPPSRQMKCCSVIDACIGCSCGDKGFAEAASAALDSLHLWRCFPFPVSIQSTMNGDMETQRRNQDRGIGDFSFGFAFAS